VLFYRRGKPSPLASHWKRQAKRRTAEGESTILATREIASAIVIDTLGRFLLQRRDDIPGILHPGKVALFGGHREGDETYLECAVRELNEELSYPLTSERFEHLVTVGGSDKDVEGGTVRGDIFVVRDIPIDELIITEGSLLIVERTDLATIETELTPFARFAITTFLNDLT
jgi:8-oxo-dGTP diphosphatase